jgi:hypothetical protein
VFWEGLSGKFFLQKLYGTENSENGQNHSLNFHSKSQFFLHALQKSVFNYPHALPITQQQQQQQQQHQLLA